MSSQALAAIVAEQDVRIEARKEEYQIATAAFAKCWRKFEKHGFQTSTVDQREVAEEAKTLLFALYAKHKAFFACVESCISEGSVGGTFDHPDWIDDRCGSADDILSKLPTVLGHLQRKGKRLGLKGDAFKASPHSFRAMQGLLAAFRPDRAQELKRKFLEANLHVAGFENPLRPRKPSSEQGGNTMHFHAPVIEPHFDMKSNVINTSGTSNIINVTEFMVGVTNTVNTKMTESRAPDDVKDLIRELSAQVKLIADKIDQTQLQKMGKNLTKLSEEVASSVPEQSWYEVSLKGLKDAANAVGELGVPILTTLAKLAPLLLD